MGTLTASKLTDLCVLAEKYGTDKLGFYTPVYDLFLSGRRDRVSKVLEVGIGTPETMRHVKGYKAGASLRMWRDYFPNAAIYGLDINSNACIDAIDGKPRIFTCCCDSTSIPEDGIRHLALGGLFDLIVDDGDHRAKKQMETFHALSPLLAPGGLYIIEDADFEMCDHINIRNVTREGIGKAIIIRQEALNG